MTLLGQVRQVVRGFVGPQIMAAIRRPAASAQVLDIG
jgi:hypothetical protein